MNKTQKIGLALGLAWAGRKIIALARQDDLRGQVVLITGGSRGLGLALAREFAALGCVLALCARDPDELARAKAELAESRANVETFVCDLREREQVARLIADATAHFGQINILVNNAGVIEVGPIENMALYDFEDALASDFWGTVYPTLAVLPQMRARKAGRIVNITSIGGKVSVPHLLPYSCAKFAATGFSEGLRAEAAKDGVRVTTIIPGLMRTGSFLNAEFKGKQAGEFAWFTLGDNIPGLSLSAKTAARAIVQATRRGEAERVLGLPAQIAALAAGVFPGLAASANAVVNSALPPADAQSGNVVQMGAQVRADHPSAVLDSVAALGFGAARDLNENN